MAISQRIYDETKKKLDALQARLLLEKVQEKKLSVPELIENTVEFAEKHEAEFKQMIKEKYDSKNYQKKINRPEFLSLIEDFSGSGSPEDFTEYKFDDI